MLRQSLDSPNGEMVGCTVSVTHDKQKNSDHFFNLFYKLFDVIHADTPALIDEAHRIRYKVFCLENEGYEDASVHKNGMEKDEFDERAEHALLVYKPEDLLIGTVRIIKPDPDNWQHSFPLQDLCNSPFLQDEELVKKSCEVSRFCISNELREIMKDRLRLREKFTSKTTLTHSASDDITPAEFSLINRALAMAPIGLMRGMCEAVMQHDILNYFAIMEPRHLKAYMKPSGVIFEEIGPKMDYHGMRVPFMGNILDTYDNMMGTKPDIWRIMTFDGENHRRALELNKANSTYH
ncbi:MAG: PEP-CTERM/exosortase system-associated acyltransferase [Rhodospirillales bacterium]|nr:PEP-CTERM/exosortase system-associated acyltransferase [Alphaproteobacteria bacterium]MCB9981745.1 PEP-CTERM/exosortase system-associated acyltransferase [Rhodospirillales bacterium]